MNPKLRPKNHAEEVALFRSEIIGGLVHRELARGDLANAFRHLSNVRFRPPGADRTRTYSRVTLRRWYDAYRKGGLEALVPKPRGDRGHARALTPEQRELLCDIRREHPSASAALILRTLVADGRIEANAVSAATVRRLFRERGLDRIALRDGNEPHMRRRWQAENPYALWHGDEGVLRQKPYEAPDTDTPRRTLSPRLASGDPELLANARRRMKAFERGHREALVAWRAGDRSIMFPTGTYAMRVFHGAPCASGLPP